VSSRKELRIFAISNIFHIFRRREYLSMGVINHSELVRSLYLTEGPRFKAGMCFSFIINFETEKMGRKN